MTGSSTSRTGLKTGWLRREQRTAEGRETEMCESQLQAQGQRQSMWEMAAESGSGSWQPWEEWQWVLWPSTRE